MIISALGFETQKYASHFADFPPNDPFYSVIEGLYSTWIDSRLWDGMKAFAPEGKLYFRPEEPVTRGQFAELLYLAHIHIGPLFEDHPADLKPIPVPH